MNIGAENTAETPAADQNLSHNLFGQRLGRKGLETRERILVTALGLIETSRKPVTLSGVARAASVGMTTLYLYFPDLGDLMLACLNRVTAGNDAAFLDQLRERWPDHALHASSLEFVRAYHCFCRDHARILQMRNRGADAGDPRFMQNLNRASRPIVALLIKQMDGDADAPGTKRDALALLLMLGLERLTSALNNENFFDASRENGVTDQAAYVEQLLNAQAELIRLTIRDERDVASRRTTRRLPEPGNVPRERPHLN